MNLRKERIESRCFCEFEPEAGLKKISKVKLDPVGRLYIRLTS